MIVLDSSAFLAVILEERGADRVEAALPGAVMSAATLAEVLSKAQQRGLSTDGSYKRVVNFGIRVMPVNTLHARIAAEISRAPRELDLSLGDRLCLALAIVLECGLVTSDRGMAGFVGIPVTLFR
ncbi:MAG TPA: type II toxin-antitoxin system VapC family toxin [Rhizomicrobium sp.]|nr:type II toxin-antitoxin system VapC family toxin [Rhizomicrobium sp.]